jgi:hypothetical protein
VKATWTFSVVGLALIHYPEEGLGGRARSPPVPPIGSISRVIPSGAKAFSYDSRLRA